MKNFTLLAAGILLSGTQAYSSEKLSNYASNLSCYDSYRNRLIRQLEKLEKQKSLENINQANLALTERLKSLESDRRVSLVLSLNAQKEADKHCSDRMKDMWLHHSLFDQPESERDFVVAEKSYKPCVNALNDIDSQEDKRALIRDDIKICKEIEDRLAKMKRRASIWRNFYLKLY